MPKLAALPGGAAVNPEQFLYLRVLAEGGAGPDGPHVILLRVQGFPAPIPLDRHDSLAAAEAALDELTATIEGAGDGGITRLPRCLSVKTEEVIFIDVAREKTPGGHAFVASIKLDSEDRPIELASFPEPPPALEFSGACLEALNAEDQDFALLGAGTVVRKQRVQRVEVRADQGSDGTVRFAALARIQSEARRLTVARNTDPDKVIAAAKKAIAAINEDVDSEEQLIHLAGGFSVRPDGLKAIRVRGQKIAGGKTVFAVLLLTDDDEELPIDMLEDPAEAEGLVNTCIERFNAAAEGDDEDDDDDGDDEGEDW